ncbi:MAG: hypothetical protein IPH89_13140 [Bacteroidetes bacterium]|jgi:hypothetical protein|nr:hypothetical protein [Bacteroidota bacterium]
MKKILYTFLFISFLFACNSNEPTMDSFKWLEGNWKGTMGDTAYLFEKWNNPDGKQWKGLGGMVINGDTVFCEKIAIHQKADGLYYGAETVENKDEVHFKYIGTQNDSVIFENKAHDFPQQIVYYYKTPNHLYAHVVGTQNGKYRKEIFEFDREP